MVGIVVTISPNLSLYKIVVLPAASRPTMRILMSFLPKRRAKSFEKETPIVLSVYKRDRERDRKERKR